MMVRPILLAALMLGCGGDEPSATADAATDAPPNTVIAVTCPTTADAMVTTSDLVDAFSPMTQTVPVTAVVKFVMSTSHNVLPNPLTSTDEGLRVDFGDTTCLRFMQAGSYGFRCGPHGFVGTIIVQ